MTFLEIKKIFEKRKFNLMQTLEHGKDEIDLSKQHQIYGAIKEIENILKTLDYHQDLATENNYEIRLSRELDQGLFQKIGLKLKNRKTNTSRKKITQ